MTYSEKLRDPRWQKKRLEILERDFYKCVICKDSESNLHIHHEKYYGEPWDVDNEFLKCVCEDCHLLIHKFLEFEDIDLKGASLEKKKHLDFFYGYKIYTETWYVELDFQYKELLRLDNEDIKRLNKFISLLNG